MKTDSSTGKVIGKVKVRTLDIAPLCSESSPQVLRYDTLSRDFTVLPAHPHVHPQSE